MKLTDLLITRLKTPIGANISSTFMGVGIQLFTQIVLVPFYLSFWGVDLYSDWIVLSAITGFFSITDIGLNTVGTNRFVLRYQEQDYRECNALLANNIVLLFLSMALCAAVLVPLLLVGNIVTIAGLHDMSRWVASLILLLFIFKIFMGMLGGVYHAIYRATSRTSRGIMANNISRIAEGLILLVCMILRVPLWLVAVFYILPAVVAFLYIKIDTTHHIYKYRFRFADLNWALFRQLLTPSAAFISVPISLALLNQGFTLIVNKFLGADSVVLFNTTRTLANFIKSVVGNIQVAIWPEFTIAYARKNYDRMRKINRYTFRISTFFTAGIAVFLCIFGKWIYEFWTKGQIGFSFSLMLAFMTVIFCNSFWSTAQLTLNATNNHVRIGPLYLLSTVLSVCAAYVVARTCHQLVPIVCCMLIVDVMMAYYTIRKSLQLTQDSFLNLLWLPSGKK